ncbi:MAG: hypothetical protein L6R19_05220 [Alphaproteobacteria bacterium]|nr:hypothetical protein [Alphaproteobacteria bacterium]
MRTAATIALAVLLAWAGTARAAEPLPPDDAGAPAPIAAADSTAVPDPGAPPRPAKRRLDPAACAELCRFFERMWSLEKRPPEPPVPTS